MACNSKEIKTEDKMNKSDYSHNLAVLSLLPVARYGADA
jgi:hypothetical protein